MWSEMTEKMEILLCGKKKNQELGMISLIGLMEKCCKSDFK